MQNIKLENITNWSTETKNDGTLFKNEFDRINSNFKELAGIEVSPEYQSGNVTVIKHNKWGQKRQVILKGKTKNDGTGLSDFLTAGTEANTVKLVTGQEPLICALANGCDEWGASEYTVKINGDDDLGNPEWTNITGTGSSEHFLYLMLHEDTQELTYGATSSVPIYSYQRPAIEFENNGQFWFDLTSFTMNQYNDQILDWERALVIFIGEVRIDTDITEIISYTIGGEYEFDWFGVVNTERYNINHNFGITNISCEVYVKDITSTAHRWQVDSKSEESLRYSDYQHNYSQSGMGASKRLQRNNVVIGIGSHYAAFYHYSSDQAGHDDWRSSAQYKVRVKRTF